VAGPRLLVDAPPFTPSVHGLLSVIDFRSPGDPHWQNGVTWKSLCMSASNGATTYDECIVVTGSGAVPEPSPKADNVDNVYRGATPFTVVARFDCSPVGNEDARQIALDALAKTEGYQAERTFWTGLVDNKTLMFPHLAATTQVVDGQNIVLQNPTSIVVTGSFDVASGLGQLEAALAACYDGVGVIHIPVKALPTFVAWDLVSEQNGRLVTANGNWVAAGSGYPGTSPSGVTPGVEQSWIYATGAVFGYRSDIEFTQERDAIDRALNQIQMIAERNFVLGFDCCHVGLLVDLGVPVT